MKKPIEFLSFPEPPPPEVPRTDGLSGKLLLSFETHGGLCCSQGSDIWGSLFAAQYALPAHGRVLCPLS